MCDHGEASRNVFPVTANAELAAVRSPAAGRESGIVSRHGIVTVNPLEEQGWDGMVGLHPGAEFFHGTGWARVLQESYGHVPVYVARFAGGRLEGLLPVMEVASALTGKRGVSLPFTDYAHPLKTAGSGAEDLYEAAMNLGRERGWKYLECRSSDEDWKSSSPSLVFFGHKLDLAGGEELLFKNLDGAMRRGIRKAESAGLRIQFADTMESVLTYYALHCQTRRRHGLPPQPFRFFSNIQRHVLQAGNGFVATARLEGKPVAGAVFFHQGGRALYKFGASDYGYQELRPNNLLMWEGIRQCAARGCASLHFGRTSVSNEGLRRFKLGFGAVEEEIKYARYDFRAQRFVTGVDRAETWMNRVFGCLPMPVLKWVGRAMYRHVG
jgi:hypothetical protein